MYCTHEECRRSNSAKCLRPMDEAHRALLFPQPERRPYVCPVCLGKGQVERGFYKDMDNWTTGKSDVERCRSCHGSGYIVV